MKLFRRFLLILLILLVAALSGYLRLRAVNLLPVDFDEDDYLRAAQEFAAVFQSGDWSGLTQFNYRPEHPPLAKIAMGIAIAGDPSVPLIPDRPTSANPDSSLPRLQLTHARTINAVFGTLTVLALAVLNPLAGLFLGLHTFTIKYVSQVMLEALPAFTSLIAVLCYLAYKRSTRPARTAWLVGSAIFLGLSVSAKYLYAVAGLAILVDWLWTQVEALPDGPFTSRRSLTTFLGSCTPILAWGLLAVVAFFAFDPYLWPAPVERLKESVLYHAGYASGAAEVQRSNYPTWQPFVWLGMSPVSWHGAVFLTAPDPFIALLALVGYGRVWRKRRTFALWLIVALLFLLVWPTKWPQYILTLTAPLSLAAAEGFTVLFIDPVRGWLARRKAARTLTGQRFRPVRGEVRRAAPWLILGLVAFLFLTIFPLLFQVGMSMTSLNAQSLRDGLNGGLVRELWGGITGQIQATDSGSSSQVHYIGLHGYPAFFDWISSLGLPAFSLLWTVLSVALQLLLGLAAAMLLWNRHVLLRKGWQTFFILPWAIPEAVGALLWLNVLAPTFGWLTLAVQEYGKGVPFSFLVGWERNPNLTLLVLLIATLWYGFPFMMLAVSAGLKLIPVDVLDASAMDGANGWQTFRHVFWPLLTPLVIPAIIIRGIFAFNQFYLFQMFVPAYGDQSPLVTLSTYSYFLIYRGSEFGFSAIINIITILMLLGFVILFNRWSKASEGVTYA